MMSWAGVATSIVSGIAQVGSSVVRFAKAVGNFNFQLVTCFLRLLGGAWSAISVFVAALSNASMDILVYLFEFLVEFGRFIHVTLLFCLEILKGLAQVLFWLLHIVKGVTVPLVAWFYQGICSLGALLSEYLAYLGVSTSNCLEHGKSLFHECYEWISLSLCYLWQELTSSLSILFHGLSDRLCLTSDVIRCFFRDIFHSCTDIFYSTKEKWSLSLQTSWECLISHIPVISAQDILTIASIIIVILFMIIVLRHHGFTVPFLAPITRISARRNILIDWNDVSILVSDEEDDELNENEADSTDNSESASTQTRLTNRNEGDDSSDDGEIAISDTDSYQDSYASESVDEFEVIEDSDFESGDENDQNAINVQLPQNGQYGLRSRVTPSPAFTKLSQYELERYLESERDKRLCVVCQDNHKNVLVLPCRHMCMCVTCAHHLVSVTNRSRHVCPLCRSRIDTVMDVYT